MIEVENAAAAVERRQLDVQSVNGGDELSTASSKKKSILPVKLPVVSVVPAKSQEEDTRDDKTAKESSDGRDDDQQSTTSSKKSICSIKTDYDGQSTTSSKKSIGSIKSAAAALLKKKVPSAEEHMGDDQSAKKSVGDETGSKRDAAAVSTAKETKEEERNNTAALTAENAPKVAKLREQVAAQGKLLEEKEEEIGELRNVVFMDSKHRELDKKRWEQKLKEAEQDKANRYQECIRMLALREPSTEKEMKRRRHALIKLEEKSHLPTTDMKEAMLRLKRLDKPSKGVVRMEKKIKSLEKEIDTIERRMEKLEESLASVLMEEYLHLEEDINVDDDSDDNDDDESSEEEMKGAGKSSWWWFGGGGGDDATSSASVEKEDGDEEMDDESSEEEEEEEAKEAGKSFWSRLFGSGGGDDATSSASTSLSESVGTDSVSTMSQSQY
jgi:hypothetical protein